MADSKVSNLTADTTPTQDDLVLTVNDPSGTPGSRKSTLGQIFAAFQSWIYGADAGSTDTYAATLSPVPAAYVTGQGYRFKANTINTGAATINFNGLGPKTIKKLHDQDLADGDIEAGQIVDLVYDGTNMQMQSQIANTPSGGSIAPLQLTSANVVEQYNSTNSQQFRVYTTRTDASNYSRFTIDGSGPIELKTEGAGSGGSQTLRLTSRAVSIDYNGTTLEPTSDLSVGLGSSGRTFNALWAQNITAAATGYIRFSGLSKIFDAGVSTGAFNGGVLKFTENAGSSGATWSSPVRTPSQITSNQNNFDPNGYAYCQRWTTDASRDVTGLAIGGNQGVAGEVHIIINVGSFDIVLKHENASSSAANRFLNSTGADITLTANQAAEIIYDPTTQRWRVFKKN